MARPRPVPPKRRVIDASACVNLRNIFCCASSGMPIPVSSTLMRTNRAPPLQSGNSTRISTCPRCVNFTAFPARFSSTWRMRPPSPIHIHGVSGDHRSANSMPLSAACGARRSATPPTTASRSNSSDCSSSRPASIFEKSSTSFKTVSRDSAELIAVCARSLCSSVRGLSSSIAVMPITPFIGVRIS